MPPLRVRHQGVGLEMQTRIKIAMKKMAILRVMMTMMTMIVLIHQGIGANTIHNTEGITAGSIYCQP